MALAVVNRKPAILVLDPFGGGEPRLSLEVPLFLFLLGAFALGLIIGGIATWLGFFLMCVGSLLPVGLMQTWASVEHGYWYARSTEFLGSPLMQNLRWMRVPGDTLFAMGALVLVAFVFAGRPKGVPVAETEQRAMVASAGD